MNISKISVMEACNCFNLHKNSSVSRNTKKQKGNDWTTIYTFVEKYVLSCHAIHSKINEFCSSVRLQFEMDFNGATFRSLQQTIQ